MLELLLVRHGETDSNVRGSYFGRTDAELNDKGRLQAQKCADTLKNIVCGDIPSIIYSSPLKRAFETACIISSGADKSVITDDRLMEQDFGVWEDMTFDEISMKYPEDCRHWMADWKNYAMGGGESALQAYERVVEFINTLIKTHKEGRVLVVSHLGCIRIIVSHLLGMGIEGLWRVRVDNGSISRLNINNEGFAYLSALNL